MKTVIRYDRKNRSTRIVRGTGIPGGRQINLGTDNQTPQARKTKKGAAELLALDDKATASGSPLFNPQQREAMIERAGDAYGAGGGGRKPADPLTRRKNEDQDTYIKRVLAHLAAK